jgi:hypothetical protein
MTQLPDLHCWIKVVDNATGTKLPEAAQLEAPHAVTVRYSFANDSHKAAGPLTVVGALRRDDVPVKPGGKPVVPAQTITVQPGQVWSREYVVDEPDGSSASFTAKLLADVGGFVHEEDETNNVAAASFWYHDFPK